MKMIVAADKNWGIGNKNTLLVRIPADQKRFQTMTLGKIIVMGRNTFESLPGKVGLYGRRNLVITHNPTYKAPGADVVHSFEEAMSYLDACLAKGYQSEDIFIIGGERVYRQFLPLCDTIYLTKIAYAYEADTYFPDLTKLSEWQLWDQSDEQTFFDIEYFYEEYRKVSEAVTKE